MKKNKTWRLEVVSKEGKVVRRPSKYSLILSEEAADRRRNSYQAFWDKYYPDLGFHVRVVQNPMVPAKKRFHVYTDMGFFVGTMETAEAFAKAQEIDGTLVEAI